MKCPDCGSKNIVVMRWDTCQDCGCVFKILNKGNKAFNEKQESQQETY